MKIIAHLSLFLTILLFVGLCLNVLYFFVSLFFWVLSINTNIFHPVIGAVIPIMLLINMISLLYSCDHRDNITVFYSFAKSNKIKLAIYASIGLINPMLLYLYTESFNTPIRIFGILKCFPVFNIFLYTRLARKLKLKGYSNKKVIAKYFIGLLILNIIKEDKL